MAKTKSSVRGVQNKQKFTHVTMENVAFLFGLDRNQNR